MRIYSKVQDWLQAGLINQTQAQQIIDFEGNRSNTGVITGFYVLATLIISLGVVSLIAFNWEHISNLVKLSVDFAALIGLAVTAFYYFGQQALKFEILVLFLILLCMASIGLIGQIYNLTSPNYVALLTWSAITMPVVLYSQRAFNWFVWLGFFLSGILLICVDKILINYRHTDVVVVSIFMVLVSVTLYSRKYISNEGYRNALRSWMILWLIGSIIILEVFGTDFLRHAKELQANFIIVPAFLALIAVDSVWRSDFFVGVQKIIASLIVLSVITYLFLILSAIEFEFIPAILTVSIFILCAVLCATIKNKYLFNLFIGLVILRCIVFYFQALGGLATTGVGLIMAGVIILFATIMWKRHSNILLKKIEGWINASK